MAPNINIVAFLRFNKVGLFGGLKQKARIRSGAYSSCSSGLVVISASICQIFNKIGLKFERLDFFRLGGCASLVSIPSETFCQGHWGTFCRWTCCPYSTAMRGPFHARHST